MQPVQIQLFVGAAAGRRARFDRSPITFGRGPDNLLIIEHEQVSRNHGEVRFENGQWVLINRSANGTKVNRKTVKDAPRPLEAGDEVSIGKTLLFAVSFEAVERDEGEAGLMAQEIHLSDELRAPPPRGKRKLWIGIGIYMGALLLAVIFLSTLGGGRKSNGDNVPELTPSRIESLVAKPLAKEAARDDLYEEQLAKANTLYHRRDMSLDGLFKTYRAYQRAIAHSTNNAFAAKDHESQVRFVAVQKELTDKVKAAYDDAVTKLKRGDDENAYLAFDKLMKVYDDPSSELYKNFQAKLNVASVRLGRKKIKTDNRR